MRPPPLASETTHPSTRSAGTTARFIQMIVLMLLASSAMTASVLGNEDPDSVGCFLAAGVDFGTPTLNGTARAILDQSAAYDDCIAAHVSPPPAWIGPLGVLLIAVEPRSCS